MALVHSAGILSGGPDGVRTRDRPVKSRTLYLTKLQAQMYVLGFLADLKGVFKFSALKKGSLNAGQQSFRYCLPY